MTERTKIRAAEKQLNIGLDPEVKSGLERVALYNSRTMRRQAALYIARCVAKDMRRIAK